MNNIQRKTVSVFPLAALLDRRYRSIGRNIYYHQIGNRKTAGDVRLAARTPSMGRSASRWPAGLLTGGTFSLASGFWGGDASIAPIQDAPFDFDGDGKTDIGIFRPSVAEWWINRSSTGVTTAVQFGASTDKIAPGDFTGDGKTDITFWQPSTGFWFVLRSETSRSSRSRSGRMVMFLHRLTSMATARLTRRSSVHRLRPGTSTVRQTMERPYKDSDRLVTCQLWEITTATTMPTSRSIDPALASGGCCARLAA
jgi:hypothetical protein